MNKRCRVVDRLGDMLLNLIISLYRQSDMSVDTGIRYSDSHVGWV